MNEYAIIMLMCYLGGIFIHIQKEVDDFVSGDIVDRLYLDGGDKYETEEELDEYLEYIDNYYSYISAGVIIIWPIMVIIGLSMYTWDILKVKIYGEEPKVEKIKEVEEVESEITLKKSFEEDNDDLK